MMERPCCSSSLARAKTASAPSPVSWATRVAMFGMAAESYHSALERQAQRKLNQARRTGRRKDFAERTVRDQAGTGAAVDVWRAKRGLDVGDGRVCEVGVVPHVEEVGCKTQIHAFGDRKILQDGEVPVLLVGAAVAVASEVAKDGHGSVAALSRRERRSHDEVARIQIAVQPAMNTAGCVGATDGSPRRQGARESRRVAGCQVGGARSRIENREGRTRLDDGDAADRPTRQDLFLPAVGGGEEWQIIAVAQGEALGAVEVGGPVGVSQTRLIVVSGIEGRIAARSCVQGFREGVRTLDVAVSPVPRNGRLQRVVVGVGIVRENLKTTVAVDRGNGAANRAVGSRVRGDGVGVATRIGNGDGVRRAGQARGKVGARFAEMDRMSPDVAYLENPLLAEFPLDGQVPLLGVGHDEVAWNGEDKQG